MERNQNSNKCAGVSNYEAANIIIKTRRRRLVERLHRPYTATCNEHLVY